MQLRWPMPRFSCSFCWARLVKSALDQKLRPDDDEGAAQARPVPCRRASALRSALAGLGTSGFWLEEHSAPPYVQPEVLVSALRDNRDGLRTFTERLWETVRSGTHAEMQARFHDALFFLGLCELSSSGESTVDKPLSTHDVKIARVTALFRTALANGHFALSDILDRHAEARREHQELLST